MAISDREGRLATENFICATGGDPGAKIRSTLGWNSDWNFMSPINTLKWPVLALVARSGFCRGGVFLTLAGLACLCAGSAPAATLGTTMLLAGAVAGSNGVVLAVSPAGGTWTAGANDSWLHLNPATTSGVGSTNVLFTYDANAGATRTGSLSIAGLTVTVTQTSPAYVPFTALDTLAGFSLGVTSPIAVALDGQANVYIADGDNDLVSELPAGGLPLITLASAGLGRPAGVAVDVAGNVYIADQTGAVFELPQGGSTLISLADASSGLSSPTGGAVDGAGNIYIADVGNAAVYELPAGGTDLITLVSSGLNLPTAVAVDVAGNVFITDAGNRALYELRNGDTALTTLVASGLNYPTGVAVDGSGNVYIADEANQVLYELPVGGTTLTTLANRAAGVFSPYGVAVDGSGNLYIADQGAYQQSNISGAVFELAHAFSVPPTPLVESPAAGNDSLPAILPATANLTGSRSPASDSSWLNITSTAGGVVSFSFADNSAPNRTAHINVLGQIFTVIQGGPTALGTTVLVAGPAAGTDSVLLAASPTGGTWTTTANNPWLHVNPVTASGVGSTNVLFGYDANPGPTRTGSLTIAGLTATVAQAGSTYTPVTALITLANHASGLNSPVGVAVDGAGNVDIADLDNDAVYQLPVSGVALNLLAGAATGLSGPSDLAADAAGDVFIADGTSMVYELTNRATALTTLVSQSYIRPAVVAVDATGNVYVGDNNNGVLYELPAGGSALITLADYSSGLSFPVGLAVDGAGNVYIADQGNNTIEELPDGSSTLITLASPSTGLNTPAAVAVDGSGSVYIADQGNQALYKLPPGGSPLITLATVSSGLNNPSGVAVDGAGNVYVSDSGNQAVYELPNAFVDTTAKTEGRAAGSDHLPVVLPSTVNMNGPFTPTSDSAWLTITGTAGGMVSYTFTANPAGNRTAHISLLGQVVPVTQYAFYASENPSGFKDGVSFTANQPAGATGNAVFLTNNVPLSTNALSSGAATSAVTALLPRGTNLITVEYAGDGTYADLTNTLEQVVTNHPPVAATYNLARTAGLRLHIFWANVATNWSDVDGDPVTLTSLNLVTTEGVNLLTNSTQILYTNNLNVNDQISCTVTDGQGATNTGLINVVVNPFVISRQSPANLNYGANAIAATFIGIPGFNYEVQRSTNLMIGPGWVDIATNTAGIYGVINVNDTFLDQGGVVPAAAYYRLEWQP